MKGERLSKTLAASGLGSRRALEAQILAGKVKVNGVVVKTPQTRVTLGKDKILVGGRPVRREEKKVYYILNKPRGYLCSNKRTNI